MQLSKCTDPISGPTLEEFGKESQFFSTGIKTIEPAHKLKIDQNKLQNCRSNILNLVNVL
ncbi:hypothetical protein D1AOALGA4SA_2919 [Olavius algarvensis Delta 1 endosymbiont]|nr:hypothetical protein D1AOALGA4SA_2919 [Olavius algarvensis Delta 1 endosymbiont]